MEHCEKADKKNFTAQEELQTKLRIEEIKNQDSRQVITFKDAPPPLQAAMMAKAGIIPQELGDYILNLWIQSTFPQFFAQQQQEQIQQMQMQQQMPPELQAHMLGQTSPDDLDTMVALSQMNQQRPQQNQQGALTQAAAESLARGITPAM